MARVPYNPVPSAEPSGGGTPGVGLSVPGAAFGTSVAAAEEGVGKQLDAVGTEIGRQAIAYQELNNETWAKNADVDTMIKIGMAQSEFNQLEGQAATAALPGHMERIKQIRQEALEGAPNPMARKLLDSAVARRVGFAIVDAGGRAGQQAKVAANQASTARVETEIASFDPRSSGGEASLAAIHHEEVAQGEIHGSYPETVANNVRKAQSKAILAGITKIAPNDPQGASDALEKYKPILDADPAAREAAQNVVNRAMAVHGSRQDAATLLAGGEVAGVKVPAFDPSKGVGQLEDFISAAKKVGEAKGKNNPDYPDAIVNRVRQEVNVGMAGYRDTQLNNEMTVKDFIHGTAANNKMVTMDAVEGPDAPVEIREAYRSLSGDKKRAIQAYLGKETKVAIPYTPERAARFNTLMGQSDSDPQKFAELTLLDEDLPRGKVDALLARQRNIIKKVETDASLTVAFNNASGVLRNAGIDKKDDRYDEVKGAFFEEVRQFQEDHKRRVTYEEGYAIASRLINQKRPETQHNFFGFRFGGQPMYEVPVKERDKIISDAREGNPDGPVPSPSEIRMIYNMHLDEERRKVGEAKGR